ncbi:hypothetical protein C9374_011094 [Naegleria lovaniensis]|uniref:Autocrine proliferation repressor A-like n=1 Tax=Naegleria lovaniensis TaxID=51637 RepID=A0AA88KCP1_NAELO|nr:uncharacterized protein C9374_011094 [Naegleria lovaniensis]KAG2374015.1 hypothetical protein C9374_011094 [Naegleria lovaniensis]
MRVARSLISLLLLSVAVLTAGCLATGNHEESTSDFRQALHQYVHSPSDVFSYRLIETTTTSQATIYTLNITSLTWLPESEVGSKHIWYHFVTVAIPNDLNKVNSQGFFFITNGRTDQPAPGADATTSSPVGIDAFSTSLAVNTKSIAATLYLIPNQPMSYNSDPEHLIREEDAIIGFGWRRFMNNTADNLLYVTQLPMVKASKLSLDAVQHFVQQKIDNYRLETFMVGGNSKRGWTTLLLGGVDNRVNSIVPVVIPTFGTKRFIKRSYDNMCAWPWAYYDYVTSGVTDQLFTPEFEDLTDIVDPLHYDRLDTIQKYQILAMGDEFFSPDLNSLSYRRVKGDKYVRYVPNAGHFLQDTDFLPVLQSYYYARHNQIEIPKYQFSHEFIPEGLLINVKITNGKRPTRVQLWSATNLNGPRDFRTTTIGVNAWTATELSEIEAFEWQVLVRNPVSGYTAAMVELVFENYVSVEGVQMAPLKFTTNSYITPNTLPCDISPDNLPTRQMV